MNSSVSDIWVFGSFVIMTSKWRHTLKFLMNLNSRSKNSPMCQIWAWSSNYLENNSSFFVFSTQKITWHTGNKRLLWQHLTTMVIDKIRKMSIKGVKLKSESFFSISPGVLELWRKNLRGGGFRLPPVQIGLKVRSRSTDHQSLLKHRNFDFALFEGGRGDSYLYLIFRRVEWQKFQLLPWKSRGVVGRVAHAKSSDPATTPRQKKSWNVHLHFHKQLSFLHFLHSFFLDELFL